MFQMVCLIFLSNSVSLLLAAPRVPIARPRCADKCGNVTIPFPFGIGRPHCFLDDSYEIICHHNHNSQVPRLKKFDLKVLNITLPDQHDTEIIGRIVVSLPITHATDDCSGVTGTWNSSFVGSNFFFSTTKNVFTMVGCTMVALMRNTKSAIVGCESECKHKNRMKKVGRFSDCSGFNGCCQTTIPSYMQAFSIHFHGDISTAEEEAVENCRNGSAFLVESSWVVIPDNLTSLGTPEHVPVVLDWGIASDSDVGFDIRRGYRYHHNHDSYKCSNYSLTLHASSSNYYCYCDQGYRGNPYLIDGCQDINECEDPEHEEGPVCGGKKCLNHRGGYSCVDHDRTVKLVMSAFGGAFGAFLLLVFGRWLYKFLKRRKNRKLREKYFKRNGGLLLQQQLATPEGSFVEKSKLFDSKELETATDKFNANRILGQGGQGTVYKGMLTDVRIVAVKKSLVLDAVDEGDVEQFINEVLILSQVNHRNVVKLLGFCLETEVPLLVYEYIPNSTLYQHLHVPDDEFQVTWDVRLRIATEVARALAYLHSAASIPIYHRDIKTSNILLDEKFRAKVADFGTSRLVALDQTHVTTLVHGTFGYLDPEYFQSSQFTDKSDVYSFGVVLVELLTRQKPITSIKAHEGRSLATYFIISMEENFLLEILDVEVLNRGNREEIMVVANLARRCLNLSGRNRPTMQEVAMELEGIKKSPHLHMSAELTQEKNQHNNNDEAIEDAHNVGYPPTRSSGDADIISTSDSHPLLPTETW